MNTARSLLALGLAVACLSFTPAASAAAITPAWSVVGDYNVPVDPGFISVAGSFLYPLGGGTTTVTLNYDTKALLTGGGVSANFTVFSLKGTFAVDPLTHEQHVHLVDPAKIPLFTFDGILSTDGNSIVGTYTKHDGYLDFPGEETGPLTMDRTGFAAQTSFTLAFATRMDVKGRVRGKLNPDGKTDTLAKLSLYGARVLADGRIKGKVKTDATGYTTGLVTIVGKGWKLKLTGPIEAAGFHASCDLTAAGFVLKGIPLLLPVIPGPPPPVGPPPKPPKNLLTDGEATVIGGQVSITHSSVPTRFFGTTAGLTIEFPYSDGLTTVPADTTDASTVPTRRCIVSIGGKIYGTASAPAGHGVSIQIRKLTTLRDGMIEVLVTGRIYPVPGRPRSINLIVQARVQ